MRFEYNSLHYIQGLSQSALLDKEIYRNEIAGVSAFFVSGSSQRCLNLDRNHALANMIMMSEIHDEGPGTLQQRLDKRVQELRDKRAQRFPTNAFLLFHGTGECQITKDFMRDCGTFSLAIDPVRPREIRSRYEALISRLLAAISISIYQVVGLEKLSEATIFFEDTGKPVFSFNLEGGRPKVVISKPVSVEDISVVGELAHRISGDDAVDRVVRLLNQSLEADQDELRRFLSGWMSLEVFVNANFGDYERRFWDVLASGVTPAIRERYLKRICKVMSDKYTALDKFIVISAELSPTEADADIGIFLRGKKLRDEFSHGEPVDEHSLPVSDIQALIRKFLRLHITRA